MAGNIIPAIATTNAIVAGCIVVEALKVLSGNVDACKTVYLNRKPNFRGHLLAGAPLEKPNPKCYVCSAKPEVMVKLDTSNFTVKNLEEKILKQQLNMIAPDVCITGTGTILISSEEGETEAIASKKLSDFNLGDGSQLSCDDFLQQYSLRLIIQHCSDLPKDVEYQFTNDISEVTATASAEPPAAATTAMKSDDELECMLVSEEMNAKKRPRSPLDVRESPGKRKRTH